MAPVLTRTEEARALRLARSQPESAGRLTELIDRIKSRAVEAALGDTRVSDRLAGLHHRVLAVDYREDKPQAEGRPVRLAEVCVYDYENDVLAVAVLDLRGGSVVELYDRQGAAPPISDEELSEARQIATAVPEIARALRRRAARVVAFPTPSYAFEARPGYERHRGCTLYVENEQGRTLSVTVDLSARQVVPDEELPEILRSGTGRHPR